MHVHSVYDTDMHFIIDPISRAIRNEAIPKTTVVQYDHNSERFTFEIPRYVEGHDMSTCNRVRVHYINIGSKQNRNEGVYDVDDLEISPNSDDVVICSWLISQNATKLVGPLDFKLAFACESDGALDYLWNTAINKDISVSDGMDNGEAIVEQYADILEQWEARIEALEQGGGGGSGTGADGFSPVATVAQTDTGAIITITDKTGTTTATVTNGKDGEKGDPGEPGQNGSDYVLTDDDISEIAEKAATLIPAGTSEVFIAEYGKTTASEIHSAAIQGKPVFVNVITNSRTKVEQFFLYGCVSTQAKFAYVNPALSSLHYTYANSDGSWSDIYEISLAKTSTITSESAGELPTAKAVYNYAQPKGNYALESAIPTKVSQLTNDSGYLTGYTETDPTVPAWAKQSQKPTYTASEVGALPNTTVIPTVPTKVSAFTNDAGYLTKHQDISGKLDKNQGSANAGKILMVGEDGNLVLTDMPTGGGDVAGYVDENNNIILNGNLADGTYSIKYEMADGSTVDIGNLVLDNNVYYTVTNNLTNCTNSNSATEAIGGQSYSATISVNSGYKLTELLVTMGGNSVGVDSVTTSGGTIDIAEVTGDIVITAVAEESGPAYTNLATPDASASGQSAWESGGWCNASYMAGSSYAYRSGDATRVTTNIFAVEHGDTIYVKGINYTEDVNCQLAVFDSSGAYVKHASTYNMDYTQGYIDRLTGTAGSDYWYFNNTGSGGTDVGVRFIRIAGYLSGEISDVIITQNEPIA